MSSFIRNFLQIAVLLPGPTSLNFLSVLCDILLQVPKQSHNIHFLKVFPSDFLENLCDILSRSIEPSLLWNKVFVFMSFMRSIMWQITRIVLTIFNAAETGSFERKAIWTRNLYAIAYK